MVNGPLIRPYFLGGGGLGGVPLGSHEYGRNFLNLGWNTWKNKKITTDIFDVQWVDGLSLGFQANGQQNHRGFGFAAWKNTMAFGGGPTKTVEA